MEAAKNPKISIVLPVYNTAPYLTKCLDSLISQTYKNIEIICVNDSSKDNSLQILNEYGQKDSRIIIVTQENTGLSGARNKGLSLANGEYIMFVDSDDWVDESTCATALETAIKHGADVVFWPYIREFADHSVPKVIFDEEEIVFANGECEKHVHRRFAGLLGDELAVVENADAIVTAWGKLYKACVMQQPEVRFIDTKIIGTEDALFNFYVFNNVKTAVYINRYFSHYRRDNENSLTQKYKPNLFKQWNLLYDLMEKNIEQQHLSENYKQALQNRIALSIVGLGINLTCSAKTGREKRKELKSMLCSARYKTAYKQLTLKYFPIHWKLFFFFAKHNIAWGVYMLLLGIQKMRGHG